MKYFNKIASACCFMALGLTALTGCEGGELYDVNAPDWISDKIQEIEDANKSDEEVLEGMQEDVYTVGNTDFSSGFNVDISKYYVVPNGQKWNAVVNLHINPDDNTYYKNLILVLSNDANRGENGYKEYGYIRFDYAEGKNSQWGDYIDSQYASSTMVLNPQGEGETDPNVQKLGGKVTLTVDRTNENAFLVKMTNGAVTKTYEQPSKLENLNTDANNTNIRCVLTVEGSYIDFQQTNIVPIGGLTSAADKNPVSMELQNVPTEVGVGTPLEEAMAGVTAKVTFEEGVTKDVTASELQFSAIPDIDQPGEKTLVAIYNKTFQGNNCDSPIMANATFNMVEKIVSIAVTTQPTHTNYYYYVSDATQSVANRTLAFDPTGMKVTATYADGSTKEIDNSKLSFSSVPAKEGSQNVTISTSDNVTATTTINVTKSTSSEISYSGTVGKTDNTTTFLGAFSDNFQVALGETKFIKFINHGTINEIIDGSRANWFNFLVVLRSANNEEYAVLRADNYAMGNGAAACIHNGTQGNWGTWLDGMNKAEVTVYVTNCGNGTADVQAIMHGSTGQTSTQYYLGVNTIKPEDLYFALSVEKAHLVFGK